MRRISGLGLAAVTGAWVMGSDVAAWLPAPAASAVREAEAWLAPMPRTIKDILLGKAGGGPAPSSSSSGGAVEIAFTAQAMILLDRIRVEEERPRGFDRSAWPHWIDADGNCRDTRQEVLASESLEPVQWDAGACRVLHGLWHDVYTGEIYRDPRALDVDHLVPLAEAHRSGGSDWDGERRAAFANDLRDSRSLIAVGASVNRSKGDQGPEEWLPPLRSYHCPYVAAWVDVKVRWTLSMDERERVTVGNILLDCARAAR